ncbi:MAG: heavy metal-binding domain-containing protein, partial [Bdellovibrionales bacterium]
MKRRIFLVTVALISVAGIAGCTKQKEVAPNASTAQVGHEDPQGYYTCPMHPQVHDHEPGKCPICGMALVKVSGKKQEAKPEVTMSGHEVHATNAQLNLAGIGKYTVERKNLVFAVPVSGRLVSAREVIFQV